MQITEDKILKEKIYHDKLDNNLQVFFMPKKGFNKKYAVLATNFGSNDLEFVSPHTGKDIRVHEGIAHFLEHKMFEQPEGGNAFDYFAQIGASANAYTNFNMTAYLFSATENFNQGLKHLISYVQTPYFTEENVEKEKGIIAQEIKMYEDNPDWQLFFNTLKGMYVNHPNNVDIAGTVESIYGITFQELYECYNTFYSPSNMALFVIGDLDFEEIMEVIRSSVKDDNAFEGTIERIEHREEDEIHALETVIDMEVSVPMFSLGFKEKLEDINKDPMFREISTELILDILFRRGSQLFEEFYMQGLVFGGLSGDYVSHRNYGYTILSGESRNIPLVWDKINEAITEAIKNGLPEEDFLRAKKKKIGSFIRSFDSIEGIANGYLSNYFKGLNILEYYDRLAAITLEELNERLASHFDFKMQAMSIINPLEEQGGGLE